MTLYDGYVEISIYAVVHIIPPNERIYSCEQFASSLSTA